MDNNAKLPPKNQKLKTTETLGSEINPKKRFKQTRVDYKWNLWVWVDII